MQTKNKIKTDNQSFSKVAMFNYLVGQEILKIPQTKNQKLINFRAA
jgi:hypothetical protein